MPANFDFSLAGSRLRKTLQEWSELGVVRVDGTSIPSANMSASVILPSGATGPAFLAYANFRTTMVYNPSIFYALTVGLLADRYTGGAAVQHMPVNEQAMSVADVKELQKLLNAIGFDSGTPDGRVGRQTRSAVRAYQDKSGLPTDGHASGHLLKKLRQ